MRAGPGTATERCAGWVSALRLFVSALRLFVVEMRLFVLGMRLLAEPRCAGWEAKVGS